MKLVKKVLAVPAVKHAINVFTVAAAGSLASSAALSALAVSGVVSFSDVKKAAIASVFVGSSAIFAYIQKALSDAGKPSGLVK